MITLDIDLTYLSRYYNISTSSLEQYRSKSITQIMQIEAAKGNAKAAEFLLRILSEPKELANLFQLINPNNRYLILQHMNEDDLMKVMEHLETKQFIIGLSMLNQEALVKLMMFLPPESLATVVLEKMDPSIFLKLIPEKFMDEFLTSEKMDRNIMMKALANVDEEQLQKMMEHYTGESCYEDGGSILSKLDKLSDDQFSRAILSFESDGKRQLITEMLHIKPDLFEEFSPEAMVYPFMHMEKEDILKSLKVLEPQEFLPMVQELPQEVMALVATQVDPNVFAEILCQDFRSVIADCGINF